MLSCSSFLSCSKSSSFSFLKGISKPKFFHSSSSLCFDQINPANGQVLKKIDEDSPQKVIEKFNSAKNAQSEWRDVPIEEKKKYISLFAQKLKENSEPLAKLLTSEMGKPIKQSIGEIKATIPRIDYFVQNVDSVLQKRIANATRVEEEVRFEPLGTIVNISAWNYPYFVGTNVFIPALLTGNTVLYKPSEYVSQTGLQMTKLLWGSGIPKDVFIPVIGGGQVAEKLLEMPIDGVFFTGSNATGQKIAEKIGPKMIRMQLELGGKDPTFVMNDVDVEKAAQSLVDGAFFNSGQGCCSVERIYVHKDIYSEFLGHFERLTKSLKVGDPLNPETFVGPLTLSKQPPFLKKQVEDAISRGGKVLAGGNIIEKEGNWFQPTVIVDANHEMDIMKEESFGPIVAIQPVSTEEEAISKMNDTKYGLTASVYTNSREKAESIMSKLDVGTVYWNACDRVSPYVPWSGRKGSGIGMTLGLEGFYSFMKPKSYQLMKS